MSTLQELTDSTTALHAEVRAAVLNEGPFQLPTFTTTERDAVTSPTDGMKIWNATTKQEETWDGTEWSSSPTDSGGGGLSFTSNVYAGSGETMPINGVPIVAVTTRNSHNEFGSGYLIRLVFATMSSNTLDHVVEFFLDDQGIITGFSNSNREVHTEQDSYYNRGQESYTELYNGYFPNGINGSFVSFVVPETPAIGETIDIDMIMPLATNGYDVDNFICVDAKAVYSQKII